MIVFPVLFPGQNFLFPGTGREIYNATGREGKFEAYIPGNHGNWGFPLTPGPGWQKLAAFWGPQII